MVHVLLATYNGAQYLPALLESLHEQTWTDWTVLARDDGSTDETSRLLEDSAASDARIKLIHDDGTNLGVAANFGCLMQHALDYGARYVFFADQDDVWLPRKMATQLRAMSKMEAAFGAQTPLLVHTDLTVVAHDLRLLHASLAKYGRFVPHGPEPLKNLLVYNNVVGCSTLINRPLLEAASPVPREAVMHDWWLALCAAALGHLQFLAEPTVLYRQHGKNLVGGVGYWRKLMPCRYSPRQHWQRRRKIFVQSVRQASALAGRLRRDRPASARILELLDAYTSLFERPYTPWHRWRATRRLGIGRVDILRRLDLVAHMLAAPPLPGVQRPVTME